MAADRRTFGGRLLAFGIALRPIGESPADAEFRSPYRPGMVTLVGVPGGWELVLMLLIPGTVLAAALLAIYLVVWLAIRRSLPLDDGRN